MKAPRDNPIITTAVVGLFVLGMLYKNFLGQIKQWIHDKVAEGSSSLPSGGGDTNPADVITGPDGQPLHVPGAGGDPQIAPGVG
jgi:hypothetical protein